MRKFPIGSVVRIKGCGCTGHVVEPDYTISDGSRIAMFKVVCEFHLRLFKRYVNRGSANYLYREPKDLELLPLATALKRLEK